MSQFPWAHTQVPETPILDQLLSKTKGQLFIKRKCAGFLGSLAVDHSYVWSEDSDTAWCNGQTIGFNPQFFMWMTPASRLTVLAHELWHTGYDHMSRLGSRDPQLWNEAGDYVINNLLDSWGFDFSQLMVIRPMLDHQYDNLTTEEVYDRLLSQQPPPMPMPIFNPNSPCTPQGAGATGQMPMPGQTPPQNQQGTPTPQPGNQPGSQPGSPWGQDIHYVDDPSAQTSIKAKQIKAIQIAQMSKDAGTIPGEITLQIDEFLDPVLPWEILLARFYTELSQDDYTWARPSRRYEDEYLPSPDGDNRLDHLIYYMDVSGSVTDTQVQRFFSEVRHIHEVHQPKQLSLVTFDAKIQDEIEIFEEEPFKEIEIHGRGGTSLFPVFDHIKKKRPTAAVIFSDLECTMVTENPGVPVLWVIIGNKTAKPPFGQRIHIDK